MYTVQCYHRNKIINKGKYTLDANLEGGMKRNRKSRRRDKERSGPYVSY